MNNLQYMKYSKFGFTICKNINIFLYFSDLLIIIDIQYGTCQWNKYISLIIGHSLKKYSVDYASKFLSLSVRKNVLLISKINVEINYY